MKKRIVLSGVNLTEMGPLMVFQDAMETLVAERSALYDIIALVHKKSLFHVSGVTFLEYPKIKPSWFKRLRFEYYECRRISEEIKPYLWFAMDNITPSVHAEVRVVYCHNPSPFYPFRISEALLDWKFGLFTMLFRFLYGINIKLNHFVVVQQDWIRSEFRSRYGVPKIVVAHPSMHHLSVPKPSNPQDPHPTYRFFYPAYPRTFKNIEQILNAARELERSGFRKFEIWLTMNGTETPYAAKMMREYSDLTTVRWLGLLPRPEILRLYAEADCLLFPSKLETWGLPITEFKATGKPILAADLAYAHETVGEYGKAAFFDINSTAQLMGLMRQAASGKPVFYPVEEQSIAPPFSRSWKELWNIVLASESQ